MSATKGVVFQTSARTIAAIAVRGPLSHAMEPDTSPVRRRRSFATPKESLKIQENASAMTAVGRAQGTSMTERTRPRPRNDRSRTSAKPTPRRVSSSTDAPVKTAVFRSAPKNRLSCQRRAAGCEPAQRVAIPPASSTRVKDRATTSRIGSPTTSVTSASAGRSGRTCSPKESARSSRRVREGAASLSPRS